MISNTDTGDTNILLQNGNPLGVDGQQQTTASASSHAHESTILRESLITTAVSFLHNENVQRSPINQKQKFLQSKGLNEHEIQIAFERAGVFTNDPNNTIINFGINSSSSTRQAHAQQQNLVLPQQSASSSLSIFFIKIKNILSSAAVISSICYIIYTVYKRFIEPFFYGTNKKKKVPSIEETLQQIDYKMDNQITNLNMEMLRLREEIQATNLNTNNNENIIRELNNFKNDLDSIKGLLLNRKQFASGFTNMIQTSIPAWQLTSHHSTNDPDKNEDADGSASNSSETEVVVNKNSDSSIEIM